MGDYSTCLDLTVSLEDEPVINTTFMTLILFALHDWISKLTILIHGSLSTNGKFITQLCSVHVTVANTFKCHLPQLC